MQLNLNDYSSLQRINLNKRIIHFSFLFLILLCTPSITYSQIIKNKKDSLVNKIDELIRTCNHKINKGAWDVDKSIVDGYSSLYNYDSTSLDLFYAVYCTYIGKIKKLTTVYFYNYKVIYVEEIRVPANKQTSNKLSKYNRQYYYWNGTLLHFNNTTKEDFDWKDDISIGEVLVNKFKRHLSSGKDYLTQ